MNFSEFVQRAETEVQKYIKVKECFEVEKAAEDDDGDDYTVIYFVRSNVTGNIFIVRFHYDMEDNEFEEYYVILREKESNRFVEFFSSYK